MSTGKEVCRHLKAVRRDIADKNDIELIQEECTLDGPCMGTCPKCEQEVRYLEEKLAERKRLGKAASVIGVAATIAGSIALTSCNQPLGGDPLPPDAGMPPYEEPLKGDPYYPEDSTSTQIPDSTTTSETD